MSISLSLLIILAQTSSMLGCGDIDDLIAKVDRDFKRGNLESAVSETDYGLSCSNATVDQRILLHLKLASIHDRIGLHTNARPVAAALQSIETAFALAERASTETRAAMNLAKARYYYRAEPSDSNYPVARKFGHAAIVKFEDIGDLHGQADVVHLMGLFHLQRQEFPEAQDYFERSLALEMQTEVPRPIMVADYERHMGLVHQLLGRLPIAIEYFERSYAVRRDNGLTDQAMFAALSLGRALVASNRAAEAKAPLKYALRIAEKLNSPEARARAGLVFGDMHEQLGDRDAAVKAYEATLVAAEGIDRKPIIERARTALGRLLQDQ